MPSPFPGMDPYLEEPDLWPDVHARLIAEVQEELNSHIRPKYVARVEQRVFVSDENDSARDVIIPDVRVVRGGPGGHRRGPPMVAAPAAMGVAGDVSPIDVTTEIDEEVAQSFLRVTDVRDRSVVAVIEILGPSNKVPGSAGRQSYQGKRREVMTSPVHWIEIDLLRSGQRMFVPEPLPPHDYMVHLSRAVRGGARRRSQVWPIPVRSRLPTVPVPLRDGDADAALDLQAVLGRAYDRGAYEVDVDYDADPVPPLTGDTAAWGRSVVSA